MTSLVRRAVRRWLPSRVRREIVAKLGLDRDPQALFSRIYAEAAWGRGEGPFYSGGGSHEVEVVEPYVEAVRSYLATLERPVHLVDLGCGDFNVGRRLLDLCDRIVACDVVPELVEHNRRAFHDARLRFDLVDAIADPLPDGNVVCVRQVLQHLMNDQIGAIVAKLSQYRHWIVTEHVPSGDFVPNLDKRPGRDIRIDTCGSGVVLTAPPFAIRPARERVLCEVPQYHAIVRTTAYDWD